MSHDDTYEIPLQDQRVFGAGMKRKRVQFVPSSSAALPPAGKPNPVAAKSISNFYLNLVLPQDSATKAEPQENPSRPSVISENTVQTDSEICEVCNLPVAAAEAATSNSTTENSPSDSKARPHEASLAHQVCLAHSHPPSHLDRKRKGLAYLSAYGWDPDSRLGLGASGQGIQFPIKAKAKDDKLGIGVVLPKASEIRKKDGPEKLDAGKIRKMYEKDKKKGEKLRDLFYRNDDIDRYLGTG